MYLLNAAIRSGLSHRWHRTVSLRRWHLTLIGALRHVLLLLHARHLIAFWRSSAIFCWFSSMCAWCASRLSIAFWFWTCSLAWSSRGLVLQLRLRDHPLRSPAPSSCAGPSAAAPRPSACASSRSFRRWSAASSARSACRDLALRRRRVVAGRLVALLLHLLDQLVDRAVERAAGAERRGGEFQKLAAESARSSARPGSSVDSCGSN